MHGLIDITVDGERFAGLNVHIFNPIEVFAEILSRCLGQKCLLLSLIKERHVYSQKIFCSTLENHEKSESLAQRIFLRLQYDIGVAMVDCVIVIVYTLHVWSPLELVIKRRQQRQFAFEI